MNWVITYNVPDNETEVIIQIEAFDWLYFSTFRDVDLTAAEDDGIDPIDVYFYLDLRNGTWYEKYGGRADGIRVDTRMVRGN